MSENKTMVMPHLACRNGVEALEFYKKAFAAEVLGAHTLPDGRLMHGALSIDGAMVMLTDEWPEHGGHSPQSLGGSPVTIHLQVADVDSWFQRAVDAGCEVSMPVENMFWGDRYGIVTCPYGHKWSIATTVKQVSSEELDQVIKSMGESDVACGASA